MSESYYDRTVFLKISECVENSCIFAYVFPFESLRKVEEAFAKRVSFTMVRVFERFMIWRFCMLLLFEEYVIFWELKSRWTQPRKPYGGFILLLIFISRNMYELNSPLENEFFCGIYREANISKVLALSSAKFENLSFKPDSLKILLFCSAW